MTLKQKLFSNMFLRNMLSDIFGRSAGSTEPGGFIPYFLYKVGKYQPDHYLYFPREPYAIRYQNEIFNKLFEYKGFQVMAFLNFHYSAYPEKHEFLKFMQFEISYRLRLHPRESHRQTLLSAQECINERLQELQTSRQIELKHEIEQGVKEVLADGQSLQSCIENEETANILSQKVSAHIEQIIASTEKHIENLASSLDTGNIEFYNQAHAEKIIQFFKLLQTVKAPPQISRTEQLFKRFSDTDIASILRLHFSTFKDKKINTLQKNIKDAYDRLNQNNAKVKKLTEALDDFFY